VSLREKPAATEPVAIVGGIDVGELYGTGAISERKTIAPIEKISREFDYILVPLAFQ
jgi:hypothetical protein